MKNINRFLLMLFVGLFVGLLVVDYVNAARVADYYFDAVNGNNANNGLTTATAKKDLDGLASLGNSISGKTVAFRDGMTYRRTSSSSAAISLTMSNVRLTNWDGDNSTNLPIIAASYQLTGWTNTGGNIWQMSGSHIESLVFTFPNGTMKWGMARSSQGALTKEFDFYKSGSTMYVYSPADPDTRYASVDSQRQQYTIWINGATDNVVDHLDLRFGTDAGILFEGSGNSRNTFRDGAVRFCGTSSGVLSGTGCEGVFVAGGSHISILRNFVTEATHHTIFMYGHAPINNVTVEGNYLLNGHYNFFDMNGAGPISNIKIKYNIAHESPYEEYRSESNYNGRNGGFWTNGGVQSVEVAYNVVYDMYEALIADFRVGQITAYNNVFVQSRPGTTNTVVGGSGGSGSVWKNNILYAATGGSTGSAPGSNNFVGNPSFVNFQTSDFTKRNFHLAANSPAINYGVNVGYTHDLDGNPIVGNPDAGAYEYTSGFVCSNGQTQACSTGQQGICAAGTQTCSNNAWGTCVRNNNPATEICGNGIDEDCNGADLTCTGGNPDTNGDGCVSLSEISAYVTQWLQGQITLSQVSAGVSQWLQGCSSGGGGGGSGGSVALTNVIIEAESGTIVTPMAKYPGGSGEYVMSNVANQGTATYVFNVLTAGQYVLEAKVKAPSQTANRLTVSMDGTSDTYDAALSSDFAWDYISWRGSGSETANQFDPKIFDLSVGNHAVVFTGGEAGVQIDQVRLSTYVPQVCTNGQTQSCTTGLLGICAAGTRTCTNNAWGSCVQNNQPATEICGNSIDEDCNGSDQACGDDPTVSSLTITHSLGPLSVAGDADDPAVWIHPTVRSKSLLFVMDKRVGVYVYNYTGQLLQTVPLGSGTNKINNVDVRKGLQCGDHQIDVVAGNLRDAGKLAVLRINPNYGGGVNPVTVLANEASTTNVISAASYLFALYKRPSDGTMYVFDKGNGNPPIKQWRIDCSQSEQITTTLVRTISDVSMQISEGAVVDEATGFAYFAEETSRIHKYNADPSSANLNRLSFFGTSDGITGDREGLVLYACNNGAGYLILSSQGDSEFKVYDRQGSNTLLKTFKAQSSSGADGLEVSTYAVPGFPNGFLAIHDGGGLYYLYDWNQLSNTGMIKCVDGN